MIDSCNYTGPSILFNDKLPLYRFHEFATLTLYHLDSTSLLNTRAFKYFDLYVDQTPIEAAVVDSFCIGGFWKPVIITGRNLLAYSEVQDFFMGGK